MATIIKIQENTIRIKKIYISCKLKDLNTTSVLVENKKEPYTDFTAHFRFCSQKICLKTEFVLSNGQTTVPGTKTSNNHHSNTWKKTAHVKV